MYTQHSHITLCGITKFTIISHSSQIEYEKVSPCDPQLFIGKQKQQSKGFIENESISINHLPALTSFQPPTKGRKDMLPTTTFTVHREDRNTSKH